MALGNKIRKKHAAVGYWIDNLIGSLAHGKKVNKLLAQKDIAFADLSVEQRKQIKDVWSKYEKVNTDWMKYYQGCNGVFSPYHVPSDVWFSKVCRELNSRRKIPYPITQDKNLLDMIFKDVNRPNVLVRNINGQLLDHEYRPIDFDRAVQICAGSNEVIIKPSIFGGGAKNVGFIKCGCDLEKNLRREMDIRKKDYVIQDILCQHDDLAALNPDSINTLRVLSLLWNGEVIILGVLVRIGVKGVRVDNLVASEGVACCVDVEKGCFVKTAYDRFGHPYDTLPNGILFEGYQLPGYHNVISAVKRLHYKVPHFRLIGWDYTVDKKGEAVMIEANMDFPEISFHQRGTGPIFGEGKLFYEVMDFVYGK